MYIDGVQHIKCSVCGEIKPALEYFKRGFYKDGSINYRSVCKVCHNKWALNHYHKNRKQGGIARQAAYRYTLRTAYGLSQAAFEEMLQRQDNKCTICGTLLRNPFRELSGVRQAVDHCHTSGKVRDILCGSCNRGLGSFKDDTDLLKRAIKYLNDHKSS